MAVAVEVEVEVEKRGGQARRVERGRRREGSGPEGQGVGSWELRAAKTTGFPENSTCHAMPYTLFPYILAIHTYDIQLYVIVIDIDIDIDSRDHLCCFACRSRPSQMV